jgi:hypothetical protein
MLIVSVFCEMPLIILPHLEHLSVYVMEGVPLSEPRCVTLSSEETKSSHDSKCRCMYFSPSAPLMMHFLCSNMTSHFACAATGFAFVKVSGGSNDMPVPHSAKTG